MSQKEVVINIENAKDMRQKMISAYRMIEKALTTGAVTVTLGRPGRTLPQNKKMWVVLRDFEVSNAVCAGRSDWKKEDWKCFLMSAYRNEMPAVGLLGEPVSMSLKSSEMTKRDFAEFLAFLEATGASIPCIRNGSQTFGIIFSEKAIEIYDEYREVAA